MPAVYVYVACCRLDYFYMSLIYGEYLVNVQFGNIPHTFIPHFTLHSAEKKIRIEFSANYPLTTFRNPHSAKYPFPGELKYGLRPNRRHEVKFGPKFRLRPNFSLSL